MKFVVKTNGRIRQVITVSENPKGDVYLRIHSGTQVGIPPHAIKVVEDRFSLHPSLKSADYITIKHTLQLENGTKSTSVALSDSVKRRNGFSHVFTHRCSDLAAPVYDVEGISDDDMELGDYDPARYALMLGGFVGHPESEFVFDAAAVRVAIVRAGMFQFVLCYKWVELPSIPFAWTFKTLTFAPEIHEDDFGKEAAYRKMTGESSHACTEMFDHFINELVVNLLETFLSLGGMDADQEKSIRELIDSVPRVASLRL